MEDDEGETSVQPLAVSLSVIAQPLAGKKLLKRLQKVVKKAASSKILRRGVKEVVKVLRKADAKFKGCVQSPVPLIFSCLSFFSSV